MSVIPACSLCVWPESGDRWGIPTPSTHLVPWPEMNGPDLIALCDEHLETTVERRAADLARTPPP